MLSSLKSAARQCTALARPSPPSHLPTCHWRRGNFLYDAETGMLNLIDFGAARDYPPHFVVSPGFVFAQLRGQGQ